MHTQHERESRERKCPAWARHHIPGHSGHTDVINDMVGALTSGDINIILLIIAEARCDCAILGPSLCKRDHLRYNPPNTINTYIIK